ncbi:MAG TPA: signal peptidase I [Verrucomicrobiae bacterium]|nr:signal peptidase I [Verrucomicrobiae bacterium]
MVMSDCPRTAGIHLIAGWWTPANNNDSSFVFMLSLELCERPVVAESVTDATSAASGVLIAKSPDASTPDDESVATEPRKTTATAPVVRAHRFRRPTTRRLIVLACIVLGMRIFVGEASVVPTASMEGTILVGDHLFMDKLLYGPEIPLVHWRLPVIKTIHRGDIVVFRYPKDPSETFLKRVTAVGGDSLEIHNGALYVNSLPVKEPYAVHRTPVHSPLESWGPIVVPEGRLFVMGDNRDNSSDSRDWGFVPVSNVIGEPMFVYWSYDAPTSRWLDENLGHKISFYASIAGNFFSHTRWSRTGMLL